MLIPPQILLLVEPANIKVWAGRCPGSRHWHTTGEEQDDILLVCWKKYSLHPSSVPDVNQLEQEATLLAEWQLMKNSRA